MFLILCPHFPTGRVGLLGKSLLSLAAALGEEQEQGRKAHIEGEETALGSCEEAAAAAAAGTGQQVLVRAESKGSVGGRSPVKDKGQGQVAAVKRVASGKLPPTSDAALKGNVLQRSTSKGAASAAGARQPVMEREEEEKEEEFTIPGFKSSLPPNPF